MGISSPRPSFAGWLSGLPGGRASPDPPKGSLADLLVGWAGKVYWRIRVCGLAKMLAFDRVGIGLALHIGCTADCDSDSSADRAASAPHDCRILAEPTNPPEAELLIFYAMAQPRPLRELNRCALRPDDDGYLQAALVAAAY